MEDGAFGNHEKRRHAATLREEQFMLFRTMQPRDYDAVYALWMSCQNMGFNNLDDSRAGIERFLKRNPSTSFVALEGTSKNLTLPQTLLRKTLLNRDFLKRKHRGSRVFRSCLEEGLLAGVILSGHDGRRGYIYHMSVGEAYRRRGVGTALVRRSLEALRAEGINKVALLVFRYNEAGNAFWEKQGFTERTDVAYRNRELTELIRIDT